MLSFTGGGSQISWGPVFDHTRSYLRKKSALSFLLNVSLSSSLTIGLWNSLKTNYRKTIPSPCRVMSQRRSRGRTTHVRLWVKPMSHPDHQSPVFFSLCECQFKESSHSHHWQCRNENGFRCHLLWEKNVMVSMLGPFVCIFVIQVVLKHFQGKKRMGTVSCPACETPSMSPS